MGAYHGLGLGLGGAPVPIRGSHLAVGGLIDQFDGAAAAYSLRSLRSNTGNVVRVRRASDNDERDFTASQVSSGEMVNWVNSQTVPPLDIGVETSEGRIPVPEGGTSIGTPAAAYSLRNLSTTYTGNVVDVRRSSDDAEESFTAEEVSDGTLEAWVLAPVSSLIGNRMYFDGVDDYVAINGVSYPSNTDSIVFNASFLSSSITGSPTLFSLGNSGTTLQFIVIELTGAGNVQIRVRDNAGSFQNVGVSSNSINENEMNSISVSLDLTGSCSINLNGTVTNLSFSAMGAVTFNRATIGAFLRTSAIEHFIGIISDVSYGVGSVESSYQGYGNTNADWEDQIGSNDGTVSKWYDQSGNDNHAVQTTPANQPTIVEGGSLVTGGIDFDGVDDFLTAGTGFSSSAKTVFSVNTPSVLTSNGLFAIGSSSSDRFFAQYTFDRYQTESQMGGGGNSAFIAATAQENLIYSAHTTDLFTGINGSALVTSADTLTGVTASAEFRIGQRYGVSFTDNFSGKVAEFILYPSDQSDNRTAIEANIGETYGITGIPAYDNTVDGFVETWYDQSGNGRDATQSVAASQPKIVDGGSLVAGAIDFDGSDDFLSISYPLNSTNHTIVAVSTKNVLSGATGIVSTLDNFNDGIELVYAATTNAVEYKINGTDESIILTSVLNRNLFFVTYDGTTQLLSANGNVESQLASESISTTSNIQIGRQLTQNYLNGLVDEIIIYESSQSANRTAIEDNINAHYDIYA